MSRPEWFEQWLAEQPPSNRGLSSTFKRVTRSLTLPDNAGPGDARIVIGSELPPPLDTYVLEPFTRSFVGAIIFYQGTPSDDDYLFIAVPSPGPFVGAFIGAVVNGVLIERQIGSGFPAGISFEATGTPSDFFTTFGLSDGLFGPGGGGITIGAGGSQDRHVLPTPAATQKDSFLGSNSATPITNTSASFIYVTNAGIPHMVKARHGQIAGSGSGIRVILSGSVFLTVATGTEVEFAVEISDFNGVIGQYTIGSIFVNPTATHTPFNIFNEFEDAAFHSSVTGLGGTYSFRLMWRRISGTGTLNMNFDDPYMWRVEEYMLV